MRVNKTSLLELTGTDRQEGVVICVGRRLLYVLGGGCYMRTNLSIGRLAPSKRKKKKKSVYKFIQSAVLLRIQFPLNFFPILILHSPRIPGVQFYYMGNRHFAIFTR